MENLKFAYHYLNFAGEHSSVLPENVQFKIRFELANGFGQLDQDDPNLQDKIWDWSHVRDSSDEALDRIASVIRFYVLRQESVGNHNASFDALIFIGGF